MFPSVPANTVEQDFKLFGSQCKLPLKINRMKVQIIDACYLPCRSALITSTVSINSFHMLSLLVSLCFLSFFVYFLPLVKHIEAFVLTQATFWTGIHYFLLSLPFLDSIFEEAVCDGQIRRSVKPVYFSNLKNIRELVSLCNLQSLLLTFSILCSYYWLTVLLLRQVFFLLQRRNCFLIKLSGRRVNCGWLYSLVYPVAIIYCIVSTAAIETTPNGAIGVCYPALERMKTAAFVLAPILLCLVCLTVAVLSCLFMLITGLFDESFGKKLRHAQPNRCDTYMEPNMTNSKKPLINEEKITNKTENNQASKPSLLPLAHFVLIYTSFWISLLALSFLNHLIYTNSPSEKEAILRSVICSVNAAFSEKLFNSTQESLGDKLYSSRQSLF
uniref:G-protein coupled receptors family 1 profile domain-containing protein n=1 Tax=Ditylenchus dipsaci TaxID=166011 RepID=A0A915CPS3_9BILA